MRKALILCVSVSLAFILSCAGKKKGEIDAKISSMGGTVTLNGVKGAQTGDQISFGDVIEIGDNSFCEIIVAEKNIFRLNKNSKLVFNLSVENNILQLDNGWLSAVSRKLFTKEGKYLVKTPTVVASVRGTSFCVKVEKPESTYFCVCNGSIELKDEENNEGEKISSTHHTARRFEKTKEGKIKVDKNPGMLYHDDASVEAIAKAINENIDWKKVDEK